MLEKGVYKADLFADLLKRRVRDAVKKFAYNEF